MYHILFGGCKSLTSSAVYQGQEQHFKGNGTPFNREPLWQSGYDTSSPLYVLTSTLNKIRNHAIKLSPDYVESKSDVLRADINHFCVRKGPQTAGNQVVFCINNQSQDGGNYDFSLSGFEPNDPVVEVLGCTITTADAAGNFTTFQFDGEPRVYVHQGMLQDTGLCETTTPAGPKTGGAGTLGVSAGMLTAVLAGWAMVFLA